jgi:hypothetical protein
MYENPDYIHSGTTAIYTGDDGHFGDLLNALGMGTQGPATSTQGYSQNGYNQPGYRTGGSFLLRPVTPLEVLLIIVAILSIIGLIVLIKKFI